MKRKDFLKNSAKIGTCACAMMLLGGQPGALAKSQDSQPQPPDKDREFISDWTENLMLIMDKNLDQETRAKIMEASGRKCAEKTFKPEALKFKGDMDGFLNRLKPHMDSFAYDKEKGSIRLVGKKMISCFCPLVRGKTKLASGTYCLCSVGWVKELFELVSGKKVQVEMEKTILRGDDCCIYKIMLT